MSGYDFANRLFHFSKVNLDQYSLEPAEVTKIESNPEKSKPLETARMHIGGLDIDCVNWRSESYSGYARNPHMVCSSFASTLFSAWDLDLMAFGIRKARTRCRPLRRHHQRPLLQPRQ